MVSKKATVIVTMTTAQLQSALRSGGGACGCASKTRKKATRKKATAKKRVTRKKAPTKRRTTKKAVTRKKVGTKRKTTKKKTTRKPRRQLRDRWGQFKAR